MVWLGMKGRAYRSCLFMYEIVQWCEWLCKRAVEGKWEETTRNIHNKITMRKFHKICTFANRCMMV